jgi:hypothetical protein
MSQLDVPDIEEMNDIGPPTSFGLVEVWGGPFLYQIQKKKIRNVIEDEVFKDPLWEHASAADCREEIKRRVRCKMTEKADESCSDFIDGIGGARISVLPDGDVEHIKITS